MEQDLQTKIIAYLEDKNWEVVKTISLSKNGYEDIFAFREGGITMFIEVKDKGCKPRPLQLFRMTQHQKMGFVSFWADTMESFIAQYESFNKH